MIEVVAPVEPPDGDDFEHHAGDKRSGHREDHGDNEAAGHDREGRGEIGAEHVQRAVRQIDQVHDAEDQRQAGRQQKQQHAELHAVQALLEEIQHAVANASAAVTQDASRKAASARMTASRG